VWKTPTQLVAESDAGSDSRSVETQFPVSSGLDHQITEGAANDAQTAAQSINVFARFQVGQQCACSILDLEYIMGMVYNMFIDLTAYQSYSLCQVVCLFGYFFWAF